MDAIVRVQLWINRQKVANYQLALRVTELEEVIMAIEELYALIVPRCSVCSYPSSPPSMHLLQLSCGHLYCNYCIQELEHRLNLHKCLYVTCGYQTSTPADAVTSQVSTVSTETTEEELQEIWSWLAAHVNYKEVRCGNENCPRDIRTFQCPYTHTREKLPVVCKLYPKCWRDKWCPLTHPPPLPSLSTHILVIHSRVAMCQVLKFLPQLVPPECNYALHAYTLTPVSTPRWVYQFGDSVHDFDPGTTETLEKQWKIRAKSCILSDNSEVFFSHMIQLRRESPADVVYVARVGQLAPLSPVGDLEIKCSDQQYQAILSFLRSIEQEMVLEATLPATKCLELMRKTGVSFSGKVVYGSKEALDSVLAYTFVPVEELYGLNSAVMSQELPPIDEVVVRPIVEELGLVYFQGFTYGRVEALYLVLEQLERYQSAFNSPSDPQLASEIAEKYQLIPADGKLYGRAEDAKMAVRELNQVVIDLPPGLHSSDLTNYLNFYPNIQLLDGQIRGSEEEIEEIMTHLRDTQVTRPFPRNLYYDKVVEIAGRCGVQVVGGNLVGSKMVVAQVLEELQSLKVPASTVPNTKFTFHQPAAWYLTQQDEFQLVTLDSATSLYQQIHRKFTSTQKSSILRIEMVQNRRMYTSFAHKHESFSLLEGRALLTMELFHGTSDTDPIVIARTDEGLDPRIGRGMWGTGSYYAKKASYSHSYCYHTPDGLAQMFLCEVIVGDYQELRPQDLKKPPLKPNSERRFHSVKGKAVGSEIWITYEAGMSYPTYLITYQP